MGFFDDREVKKKEKRIQKYGKQFQSEDITKKLNAASELLNLGDRKGYPYIIKILDEGGTLSCFVTTYLGKLNIIDAIPHIDNALQKQELAGLAKSIIRDCKKYRHPDIIRILLRFLERNPQGLETIYPNQPAIGSVFTPTPAIITGEDALKEAKKAIIEITEKISNEYRNELIKIFNEGLENPNKRVYNISNKCLEWINSEKSKK